MSKINQAIQNEIQRGAYFGRLKLPGLANYHIIQFVLKSTSQTLAGLGIDTSEKRAYLKASAEFFERKSYFENKLKYSALSSTNGVATHIFKLIAKLKAQAELIERDALFRHWFSKTPFLKQDIQSENLLSIERSLRTCHLKLEVGVTYLGYKPTTIAIISDAQGYFTIGCEAYGSTKYRAEKACLEALASWHFGNEGFSVDELKQKLHSNGLSNLLAHRTYWRYLNPKPSWLWSNVKKVQALESFGLKEKPIFKTTLLTKYPLPVIWAQCQQLIPLKVGRIDFDNLKRYGFILNNDHDIEPVHPMP